MNPLCAFAPIIVFLLGMGLTWVVGVDDWGSWWGGFTVVLISCWVDNIFNRTTRW